MINLFLEHWIVLSLAILLSPAYFIFAHCIWHWALDLNIKNNNPLPKWYMKDYNINDSLSGNLFVIVVSFSFIFWIFLFICSLVIFTLYVIYNWLILGMINNSVNSTIVAILVLTFIPAIIIRWLRKNLRKRLDFFQKLKK